MTTTPAATAALTAAPAAATQAAPAAGTTTPANPIVAPPAGGGQQSPFAAGHWLHGADQQRIDLAKAKGWTENPTAALDGYASLEKLFGADRAGRTFVLPKDADDRDGWSAVYDKLGRPKDADGYGITAPEGSDPAFAKTASGKFHELGLTGQQGKALAEWWNGHVAEQQQQAEVAAQAKSQQEHDALKAEWGSQADANFELARRGSRAFGFTGDELSAIEGAIGTRAMLEKFVAVGRAMGEDKLPADAGAGATAKEQAQAKIARLNADPQFRARYLSSDPKVRAAAIAEMEAAYQQTV